MAVGGLGPAHLANRWSSRRQVGRCVRARTAALAGAGLLVVGMTGCGSAGGPGPGSVPALPSGVSSSGLLGTPSGSSPPSDGRTAASPTATGGVASPSPLSSASPTAAAALRASAEKFVVDYWAAYETAAGQGRVGDIAKWSAVSCRPCKVDREKLITIESLGQRVKGSKYFVQSSWQATDGLSTIVEAVVDSPPSILITLDGETVKSFRGVIGTRMLFNLLMTSTGWIIQDIFGFAPGHSV